MEEAGCELSELMPIATVFPSAGACTEQVRLYCGRVEKAAIGELHGLAEEGEDILVHSVSRDDAMQHSIHHPPHRCNPRRRQCAQANRKVRPHRHPSACA